jgi:hypothetical protein
MNKLWYAAGSVLLCGAMAFAQDAATSNPNTATTTQNTATTQQKTTTTKAHKRTHRKHAAKKATGTKTVATTRDTIEMPQKKVVATKKDTVSGGAKKMAAAPADLGRGGKALGHNMKGGHPVAAAKAGGEGGKDFGTTVGSGIKNAAIGVKDKVGHGLSAIGNKVEGKDKTKANADTTNNNPK